MIWDKQYSLNRIFLSYIDDAVAGIVRCLQAGRYWECSSMAIIEEEQTTSHPIEVPNINRFFFLCSQIVFFAVFCGQALQVPVGFARYEILLQLTHHSIYQLYMDILRSDSYPNSALWKCTSCSLSTWSDLSTSHRCGPTCDNCKRQKRLHSSPSRCLEWSHKCRTGDSLPIYWTLEK